MNPSPPTNPLPAWPFIAPLALFLVLGLLNPTISEPQLIDNPQQDAAIAAMNQAAVNASREAAQRYLYVVTAQVVIVGGLLMTQAKFYCQSFPFRLSIWGLLTGVVGVAVWVWLCEWRLEQYLIDTWHLPWSLPKRVSFNPWEQLASPAALQFFLAVRFALLALIVPIAEELLLRGWFARWVQANDDWYQVSLKQIGLRALIAVVCYAVLAHPGEIFAAIAWFSLVNLLMLRTDRFWDCVLAHAVTNLLLGIYVIYWQAWHLW